MHKSNTAVTLVDALTSLGSLAGALLSTTLFIARLSFVSTDQIGLDEITYTDLRPCKPYTMKYFKHHRHCIKC